ncbi:glycosyltransferase [Paenibacillus timonensis]|uniref:glycosyltransferase n=1 Tax=Paenibacillus timonensis TaxID=225915 RepID=UPI0022DEF7D2|nr:glycosyltransferase [Paenibacillus timonensis]
MSVPRLSLCMIVRNEEDCITRCLASVQDVVDEIVIVDTGSTDKTIEICKAFGARIELFPWNDSFADARNYGIDKATGEWILWMDADEEVDRESAALLKDDSLFAPFDVMTIHLVNYYGNKIDKHSSTDIAHTRLFRRASGIRFINKIHECLDIVGLDEEQIGHLPVKFHHYGYMDQVVKSKGKFERNLRLLEQQVKDNENVYWARYYIASEYYRNKQFQEAFDQVNLSIAAFLKEGLLPSSMVYKLKYSILITIGSYEGAWPGIERAVALYPDYVDLRFFMGIVLYYLEKYDSALLAFETCIEMGEDNIHHLILRGVGSFQAWHYKGLCLLKLGRTKEALFAFLHALIIHPEYSDSLDSLAEILEENELPDLEELRKVFTEEECLIISQIIKNK